MSLRCGQILAHYSGVDPKAKHGPGVAGGFQLDCDCVRDAHFRPREIAHENPIVAVISPYVKGRWLVVEHLERSDFVIMKRPPIGSGCYRPAELIGDDAVLVSRPWRA